VHPALFRLESAAPRDPGVEAWLASRPPELQPLVQEWFARLRACGSDVRELMHDGCPVACVGDCAFAYVNAFTSHVNVGFFQGADLDDPDDLLEGTGKRMRHVKLRPDQEYDAVGLARLIEEAYADMKRRLAA
jgi:hypothetical protein